MEKTSEAKKFHHENGVTYFNKRTERLLLFVMTVGMLLWGVVEGLREML